MNIKTKEIIEKALLEIKATDKPHSKCEILRYIKNKGYKMSITTLTNYMKVSDIEVKNKAKYIGFISERILSKKEEALKLKSEGHSNSAIAKMIGISLQSLYKIL